MTPRRLLRTAAFAAAAGLVAVACGGSDSAVDTAAGPAATEAPAATSADEATGADTAGTDGSESSSTAPELLQFSAPLVGGGELDAAALADKPTAFWFWSPT